MFATATGTPLDAANVRRFFRAVCTAAGIGPGWTPRQLRHTFVSLMSDSDVAVEEMPGSSVTPAAKSPKPSTATSSGPS